MIPEPPPGELLAWALANPEAVRDAVRLLNQISTMRVTVTKATQSRDENALLLAADRSLLQLPLKFSSPVSPPSGGSTVDTNLRSKFTELLSRLAALGINV